MASPESKSAEEFTAATTLNLDSLKRYIPAKCRDAVKEVKYGGVRIGQNLCGFKQYHAELAAGYYRVELAAGYCFVHPWVYLNPYGLETLTVDPPTNRVITVAALSELRYALKNNIIKEGEKIK